MTTDAPQRPAPDPTVEIEAAIAYVTRELWPPLPTLYGPWLVELAHRARAGAPPCLKLAVPDAIIATGVIPPSARAADDGTLTVSLLCALTALRQEELLYPDDEEHGAAPLEIVTPEVALSLANTADAAYYSRAYDPETIGRLAAALAEGDWAELAAIRVDQQGRITCGLNELLAIVTADRGAPVTITYAYDAADRPLTWRGPTANRPPTADRPPTWGGPLTWDPPADCRPGKD